MTNNKPTNKLNKSKIRSNRLAQSYKTISIPPPENTTYKSMINIPENTIYRSMDTPLPENTMYSLPTTFGFTYKTTSSIPTTTVFNNKTTSSIKNNTMSSLPTTTVFNNKTTPSIQNNTLSGLPTTLGFAYKTTSIPTTTVSNNTMSIPTTTVFNNTMSIPTTTVSNNTMSIPTTTVSNNKTIFSQSNILVQKGLISTNVKQISTTEDFTQDVVVFNTIQNINNNINEFINTYFPKRDINRVNDSLMKSRNMNMQDIINNNILSNQNFNSLIILKQNDGYKPYLAYVLDLVDPSLFILFSLYILLLRKLNNNVCDYYFNDYEIEKDFITYTGPCVSDDEIKRKYNELKECIPSDGYNLDYTIINKMSWRKSLRQTLINYGYETVSNTTSSTFNPIRIFEDALIKVFNTL